MEALTVLRRNFSSKKLKRSRSFSSRNSSKSKSSKEKKAQEISKPKQLDRYVAVAKYDAQAPGEMVLYPGLRVDVLEKSDSGWWFVNSEDEQGWVPSTYLEPENGESVGFVSAAIAEPGQEENFICIEKFEGASSDEVSLEKGAVVQVLQKNMDGWWLVRYMGREAYAPGTYLKKATNMQAHALMEKSRLSGVQIISSLQDVSTLLSQEKKKDSPPATPQNPVKNNGTASALVKTKSLERGGSLIPPPRQNSVTRAEVPISVAKPSVYMTIEDFEDTVGDGLSFKTGQKAYVKEKTPTGWWFVEINGQEGWVPASYLESTQNEPDSSSQARASIVSQEDEFSDEDWYAEPDMSDEVKPVKPGENSRGYMEMAKRPLPPIPPDEELSPQQPVRVSDSPRMAHRPLPAAPGPALPKTIPVIPTPKKQIPDEPKESVGTQDAVPKATLPVVGGNNQDLATMLRAKFAARSGAATDSGNSSEEESTKPSKHTPVKPNVQPVVPKKPFEIKKNIEEPSRGFASAPEQGKGFSKPPPPVKTKPMKPPALPSKPGVNSVKPTVAGSKPGFLAVQLKPINKQSSAETSNSADSGVGSQKPKPATGKPLVPGKSKPSTQAKPVVASKPSVAAQKQGQNVSNLANNLGGKLNFGKIQVDNHEKETAVKPSVLPNKPSSQSEVSGAPVSRSYVALFDFTAENDGEISFNEGDDIEVLERQGDWSYVRIWDEEGWAPTDFLEKV